MVPQVITNYLQQHEVPFEVLHHDSAVSAQVLAEKLHVSGHILAKPVLVEADGERWMLAIPADERVDEARLASELRAHEVRLLHEDEFAPMFPGCEKGAEPPFGRLFGVPLLCDRALHEVGSIVFRGGSHEDALRVRWSDFEKLEHPAVADFAVPAGPVPSHRLDAEPMGGPVPAP